MKYFMIRYSRQNATEAEWHKDIAAFIANLDADPAVRGKISYRCMKRRDGTDYYHLAAAADEAATKALQQTEFFPRYTARTKEVGGTIDVFPLDIIAETKFRA